MRNAQICTNTPSLGLVLIAEKGIEIGEFQDDNKLLAAKPMSTC